MTIPSVQTPVDSGVNFTTLPILDYSLLSSNETRHEFISQLRHAVVNVGFFYLSNHSIPPTLFASLIEYIPQLFALPQHEKDKIALENTPYFLGYSRLGKEMTHGKVDWREQFDFASPHECTWKEGVTPKEYEYLKYLGPSQWLDETVIPGFRKVFEECLSRVQALSWAFSPLLAEAFGLPLDALDNYYEKHENIRSKIVHYPFVDGDSEGGQGIGPHYDAGFLTFLLQASPHKGFQVQNSAGDWIDAPPIPGTLVVNIGRALEAVTGGVARATSHRVLSPRAEPGVPHTPRFSVPFFQYIRMDAELGQARFNFSPEILELLKKRGRIASHDANNFAEFERQMPGQVYLAGRLKSHPDVGQRYYPELFEKIFPDGMPAMTSAY